MRTSFFVTAVAAILTATVGASAQTLVTGDITGHVTDATGAVVPQAKVTLKSDADGSAQTVTTDKSGTFRFPLLRPGFYTIHEEGAGMTADASNVAVNVGQATALDLVSKPNGNVTTIEVSTNQPLLQVDDGNVSSTFSTQQLENLPIPGGDISNLPFTTPGASSSTGGGYGNFTVFGLPSTSNLFTTNGADLMDAYLNLPNSGASNNVLGANELSEAAVVVNGYTGQYGRLAGAQVNFTTKSGTNKFHGNANFYYNSSGLNANDWFNKQSQFGGPNVAPKAVSRQWGGSIGGPVWKDKLFFFFDEEGLRYVLPGGGTITYLPSTAFQTAVMSNIAANQPSESAFYKNIFALYSGANGFSRATPSTSSDGGCGDFAGTTVGKVTFGGASGNSTCSVSFVPTNNNLNTEQLYSVRIDANLTTRDQINARFKHDWGVQATSTDPINSAFSANSIQPEFEGQLNETHQFSSRLVNSFTMASLYYSAIFGPPDFGKATATFPTTFIFGDGDGFAQLGGTDNTFPSGRNVSQYQFEDDLSITRGRHNIKTGYNFRRYNITNYAPLSGTTGSTTFGSNNDFYNGIISANVNNDGTSSTTLAFPRIAQAHLALYSIGVYVQDQFAVNSKLNLTASLRFDRQGNPKCGNSCFVRLAAPFDQLSHGSNIPYNQSILTGQANAFPSVENVTIQPRIGFAYSPFGSNGKTVIRGGAGLFADIPVASVLTRFITSAPNVVTFTLTPSGSQSFPVATNLSASSYGQLAKSNSAFQTGFTSGQTLTQIQAAVAATGSKFAAPNYTGSTGSKLQNGKFAEFNLEIQQALSRRDVIDVNYIGNVGTDTLFVNPTANAYAYCLTVAGRCPGGFGGLPAAQPDLRFNQASILTNNGHSNYNGLVASFRHQGGYGLTTAFNYTYSKSLDNTSNGGIEAYSFEATYPLTQIDPTSIDRLNYGPSDYDSRHNIGMNYTWLPPVKGSNLLMREALSGWALSGTIYAKSGVAFSVIRGSMSGYVTNGTNAGSVLGAFLGGTLPKCQSPAVKCLSSTMFAAQSKQYLYGFGNQARNSYRGPGYFDSDMQLSKSFPITERTKFKIGANAFNIINHPNFAPPSNNVASSSFGKIQADVPPVSSPYGNFQGAGVSGRIIQVLAGVTF